MASLRKPEEWLDTLGPLWLCWLWSKKVIISCNKLCFICISSKSRRDMSGFKIPKNRRITVHIWHQALFVFCLLAEVSTTGSPEEFLSAHLSLSESSPVPPWSPLSPLGPLNPPLLCFTRSADKTCATASPILYTAVQSEALLGVHLVGVMWRSSYLGGDHNLCAQSKKLSLCPSQRQISNPMHQ